MTDTYWFNSQRSTTVANIQLTVTHHTH